MKVIQQEWVGEESFFLIESFQKMRTVGEGDKHGFGSEFRRKMDAVFLLING